MTIGPAPTAQTPLLVGLDIGATKTHLRAGPDAAHPAIDLVVQSTGWAPRPEAAAVAWIDALLDRAGLDLSAITALAIGAHGYDSEAQTSAMNRALAESHPFPCVLVNDALLVVPAAGLADGIGLIVGTGAIALGMAPDGAARFAGGWGWQLGDEGSAPVLVREAARAALRNHELAGPADLLLDRLLDACGASSVSDLPERLRDDASAAAWGRHAPAVFDAAADGSPLALEVIATAGRDLAELVTRLARQGVRATQVVAAGSVIVNQPALRDAVREALRRSNPDMGFRVLDAPPVHGALRLARQLTDQSGTA
ncbi:MAG: ATPase [Actinomycetia bacterium]|nr:ATPase [Actinomycetes bacterium]